MKKSLNLTIAMLFFICLAACGWKPDVPAVQLTAPWNTLNLPVKENAVVWKSEPNEFRAVHKEDKKTVTQKYIDALKTQGWQMGKFDLSDNRYLLDMNKGGEQIHLEFYDFNHTGVLIEKK